MQKLFKWTTCLCLLLFTVTTVAVAQDPEEIEIKTESSDPDDKATDAPLDDVVEKRVMGQRKVLQYQPIRESDIMWERRVWRIIDVREKMNLPFVYPEDPFFKILSEASIANDIRVFDPENDKFQKQLTGDEVASMLSNIDTAITFDPETYEEQIKIVRNDINWEDVRRFRLKEVWFFDKETSTMQVRILGIAPLIDVKDSEGNFRYEKPMFWVYYPEVRELLARHRAFNMGGNTNATISWEDMFEMRYFASHIYKSSNVYDRKIGDYLQGVDLLMESDKIKNEIFNLEHDLWQF